MNQAGKLSWSSTGSAAMTSNGFPACLTLTSLSAYVALAADQFAVWQAIEADMVSDFAWGTANAQPVTLSFWFNGSAGTYSRLGSELRDYTVLPLHLRSSGDGTGTKIVLTIPGDTGGTWVMSGNGGALYLNFDLGSGANNRGAATGAWQNANVSGVTGTIECRRHQWRGRADHGRQAGDRQRRHAVQPTIAGQEHGRLPEVLL